MQQNANTSVDDINSIKYYTDTDSSLDEFTEIRSKKRNRVSPVNESKNKQQRITGWLQASTSTQNRFENLPEENNTDDVVNETVKIPRPPPIFVAGVQKMAPLMVFLEDKLKENYELKILNSEEIKIQAKTPEGYRIIVDVLKEKGQEFHTYKLKSERDFRVVLRGLHPSTDIEIIKAEIEARGHKVTNIHNIKQRLTKRPLPLFYVDIQQNNNNKEIYGIQKLFHTIIKFEAPNQKRELPQCTSCQRYGHTSKFCNRRPRCVKCAEEHHTKDCQRKNRDNAVKCVLCSGNHPANYRGCVHYKALQDKAFPGLRQKSSKQNTKPVNMTFTSPIVNHTVSPGITYANVAASGNMGNQTNKQRFCQESENTQRTNQQNSPQSNDMLELKDMMKVLMQQMSTMLNLLTTVISKLT